MFVNKQSKCNLKFNLGSRTREKLHFRVYSTLGIFKISHKIWSQDKYKNYLF